MKLAIVVTCLDAPELAEECTKWLLHNTSEDSTIILLDNGSKEPLPQYDADCLIRLSDNIGGNAVFHYMIPFVKSLKADLVAYLHCDMMVREENWDQRVIAEFEKDPLLALCGFVGSNEIDEQGGRGGGTMLNYLGDFYPNFGQATKASDHGRQIYELHPGAVLDHCSMIFRISMLEQIPQQEGNYAVSHFYDRICSCHVIQNGWHLGVLGISCDHFSGGIAAGMASQLAHQQAWLEAEGLPYNPNRIDTAVYVESERRFLNEFRDVTHKLIPFKVNPDYSITHYERTRAGWREENYVPT